MNANLVTIEIDGKLTNIDEKDLRISDLVIIQTGDIVPADLRLIEFRGLEIDEFEITGELLPVEKKIAKDDVIAYHGSRVIRGYGKGVVLSTGEQTEYGKVLSQEGQQNQPYTFRIIDKENLWTIILFLPVFVLLFVQSYDLTLLIIFLFFSFVLNLLQNDNLCRYLIISNESKRLKRAHVQIRDIRALEHMGDINLVCFDKTGVLTTRQMDIKKVYFPDLIIETENGTKNIEESVAQLVYKACALCNDVLFFQKTILANPIDLALIRFAQKNRIDVNELLLQYKRIYD
ncbi:hypothetical protein ADN00_09005 [Ornatilinea apprima]|uniref:P-type ATPase A domain-containing protein n=1 Tax=Ornatilinea apprima TaxID=1134406 RepID=A0A0P6XPS9_9CHLR|nr:hypothetical protein ADN00_09005 [Ornatilinea apprima]